MRHHTVTATFSASADEVFAYLADVYNLPEWATEFARELKHVDGRHKVVNGLGEFFFELRADRQSGVIDMLAGPRENALQLFPTRVVPLAGGGSAFTFSMFRRQDNRTSDSTTSTSRSCASSRISSRCSAEADRRLGSARGAENGTDLSTPCRIRR